jgi:hypothetical protein
MKKFALILVAVLVCSAFAFAEVTPTITGEAETRFGYNLDTEAYGLLSSVDSSISLNIVAGSEEDMGAGGWYGVIQLNSFSIDWDSGLTRYDLIMEDYNDDDATDVTDYTALDPLVADEDDDFVGVEVPVSVTAPTVVAKVTDGNLYVQLQSEADFEGADYVDDSDLEDEAAAYAMAGDVSGSLTVGGTFGPATVAVEVGTESDYESTAAWGVGLGAYLGVAVDPVTIDIDTDMGLNYGATDMGIAAQIGAAAGPATITAALDGMYIGEDFDFEIGAAVDADFGMATVGIDFYAGNDGDNMDAGISLGVTPMDALSATVGFDLYDLTYTIAWAVDVDVTYAINDIFSANLGGGFGSDELLSAYASLTATELISNTKFDLIWENADDLTDKSADDTNLGQISIGCELAY